MLLLSAVCASFLLATAKQNKTDGRRTGLGLRIRGYSEPVADLGGAVGGNCPLHDENSAWRLIFGKKGAPYHDPNALFFSCFVLNLGNI